MARRSVRAPPEPPWVWGPSDVGTWIEGTHPGGRAPHLGPSRAAKKVAALRVKVDGGSAHDVLAAVADALPAIGFPHVERRGARLVGSEGLLRVEARVHGSLLGGGVVVSVRFEPPAVRAKGKHLLHLLARRYAVSAVHAKEEGKGLPSDW